MMILEAALRIAVYNAVRRMIDRGLAIRVLRDEARREMDEAVRALESTYIYCNNCGELIGDANVTQSHWCSRTRRIA